MRSQKPIRVLILEDIPADTELAVNELKEADLHYELAICRTNEEFAEQLSEFKADIILTPYSLAYTNAIKALKFTRSRSIHASTSAHRSHPFIRIIVCRGITASLRIVYDTAQYTSRSARLRAWHARARRVYPNTGTSLI